MAKPACLIDPDTQGQCQGDDHDDALHEIGGAFSQIAPDEGIGDDKQRTGDHQVLIFETKQGAEQFADRHKAAGGIDGEKDQDEQGRDGQDDFFLFVETIGEEIRDRDRIAGNL